MQGEQTGRLHGEFHAGAVVRGKCVRVSSDPARVGPPGLTPSLPPISEGHAGAEPRIEIIRSGDLIQAIDIICSCGQQIRLHCRYVESK